MTAGDIKQRLDTDGFAVLPGVLNASEVERLRSQAIAALDHRGLAKAGGLVLPNAAAEAPEVGWVFTHPPLLEAVRQALGTEEPTFTMEADLHRNYIASTWHKDSGERVIDGGYFDGDSIGLAECRVFKVALYLQDHQDGSGLHVRPRSHTTPSLDIGADLPVVTRAGDAILFDVRITHRGVKPSPADLAMGAATRAVPKARRDQALLSMRKAMLRATRKPERIAVYFAFGVPGDRTDTFARRNMHRQLSQIPREHPPLADSLVRSFEAASVNLVQL